ncbi:MULTISPECIES: hypothetical protein [unclassified Lysobacter]|uniref:hypothetical protein n=1 Tax=unclassified Lysobacter TaxID=2635362 RepID=UPI001BE4E9EB|nr:MULTISPECIES: hypothetical protein [unclassified Lysobacter]MBT2747669.1 hypothetical protein [Lysobacter sp. ISL-42]MBT2752850.1 hypothetical protein [Lysobacter sp. ISL-50]MBT2779734.1 hypothetical protein [Lysobacter sp. ISL-54]MBT2780087.1 hypothetical protein [Lysobacter sp. ISL-52]
MGPHGWRHGSQEASVGMERRTRGRWIVGASITGLAVLALGLGGWWGLNRDRRASDGQASASVAADTGTRVSGSGPAAAPLPTGTFQDIHKELEVRARAGDARAAYRLGQIISRCREYKPIPGGEFTEMLAGVVAHAGASIRMGSRKLDDPDLLDMMLYAKNEADAICGGVGDLPASVRKGDARAWFELAAQQGHTKAMTDYGRFAFDDLASDADLLDKADEVVARRERARGYLRRAFESGEPESLLALAAAHGNMPFLGRDTTQSLAYWKAYRRTAEGRKLPEGVVNMMEEQLLAASTPQQVRDSERRSAEIVQAFQQHRAPR